jgi:hypothetical protein
MHRADEVDRVSFAHQLRLGRVGSEGRGAPDSQVRPVETSTRSYQSEGFCREESGRCGLYGDPATVVADEKFSDCRNVRL